MLKGLQGYGQEPEVTYNHKVSIATSRAATSHLLPLKQPSMLSFEYQVLGGLQRPNPTK